MACKYTYKGITYNSKEEFVNQVVNPQILGKADVILPIGTSGSGKSTFIKSLPQENLVVIEPDSMRVEFTGDMNDKSKDKEIYIEAANRAIQAIKNGKQVVFDTTNLTKDKRLPFIEAIKKEIPNANIQYKLMELNPELAKQRIKAQIARGENRANVPDSTIDRHAESYKQMLEDIKNEPIIPFINRTTTKTRRILEVQSDLFQKGRDLPDLTSNKKIPEEFNVGKNPYGNKDEFPYAVYSPTGEIWDFYKTEDEAKQVVYKQNRNKEPNNQFLQLLNKDNNWVPFFIKAIVQDSVKKGYEKVLFPSGNTASKVEGHTTVEEFKKQKEDRIKELEKPYTSGQFVDREGYQYTKKEDKFLRKQAFSTSPQEISEEWFNKVYQEVNKIEINQLKQELESVERDGFAALKPIWNFYENVVSKITKKLYDSKTITDEYGNTWQEITLVENNVVPLPEDLNDFINFDKICL